jgi:Phasin protein
MAQYVVLSTKATFVIDPITARKVQMSKRKPPPSKRARSSTIEAKAQRATQAIVKSPKVSRLYSVVADPTEPPPQRRNEPEQETLLVKNPTTDLHPNETKQEPLIVENSATAEDDSKQKMNKDSKKTFDFSSATANVRAYQAKLLEVAQANLQFAFEFAQRLAAVRSPLEFLSVTAEFTSKRIAMFQKYSKELAELSN